MPEPVVRILTPADLPMLLRIYALFMPEDPRPEEAQAARVWADIVRDPKLVYFGTFLDSLLVASCYAVIVPNLTRRLQPYAVIENVVTDPDHRRRGYGALAMRALLAHCWDAGCYKVMLSSGVQRGGAHAFYEALGFDRNVKQSFVMARPL